MILLCLKCIRVTLEENVFDFMYSQARSIIHNPLSHHYAHKHLIIDENKSPELDQYYLTERQVKLN